VTRTIWLASYPKSGNTWMRALLGNVLAEDGEHGGIDALVRGNASDRTRFDFVMLLDSGLLTHDEIDCLRPRAFKAIADGDYDDCCGIGKAMPVCFVKAHEAYAMSPAGESLLGGSRGACGAIAIVRDPRDVACSLAHHLDVSIDHAITAMSDNGRALTFGAPTNRLDAQFRQRLASWSGHVASWLDQTDIPVHLIRYEDLQQDTGGTLHRTLVFAGLAASQEKINRAVESCKFAILRERELQKGFGEVPRKGAKFFRRGEAGSWRDELKPEQVARIETAHGRTMQRLGYELSHISDLARAG
jgi:aryl sulfotransferase